MIDDTDPVGQGSNDGEIVGDEQDPKAERRLQLTQKLDDAGLDGNVQRRQDFIAEQHVRIHDQCPCDRNPLPLAAGELVGEATDGGQRQPHLMERFLDAMPYDRRFKIVERSDGVRQDLADPMTGVERAVRVLEDHLQPASLAMRSVPGQGTERLAVQADGAARGRQEAANSLRNCRFAAPGLADECIGLAAPQNHIETLHHIPSLRTEKSNPHLFDIADMKVRDLKDGNLAGCRARGIW